LQILSPQFKFCLTAADKSKNWKQDLTMSWGLTIFAFGFLLGGFTALLVLGIFSLAHRRQAVSQEDPGTEPCREVANPEITPQFTVLGGGKNQPSFNSPKAKAVSG
jgi:hypothetical protein